MRCCSAGSLPPSPSPPPPSPSPSPSPPQPGASPASPPPAPPPVNRSSGVVPSSPSPLQSPPSAAPPRSPSTSPPPSTPQPGANALHFRQLTTQLRAAMGIDCGCCTHAVQQLERGSCTLVSRHAWLLALLLCVHNHTGQHASAVSPPPPTAPPKPPPPSPPQQRQSTSTFRSSLQRCTTSATLLTHPAFVQTGRHQLC